jgi:outer membrane biosynthesis protein TonB
MDGGGAADLQTDVMRFMAILSLCLVAIFALVQSLPMSPTEAHTAPPVAESEPRPPTPRQAARPATPQAPAEEQVEAVAPQPAAEPVPVRVPAQAAPVPAAAEPAPAEPASRDAGFTLRFASDTALTALVAREAIGLYALGERDSRRLSVERGRLGFWQASRPSRYHEMDAATVPDDVLAALRRAGQDEAVQWGVTLPAGLSDQLDQFLTSHSGGDLVIGSDGRMRLEQH